MSACLDTNQFVHEEHNEYTKCIVDGYIRTSFPFTYFPKEIVLIALKYISNYVTLNHLIEAFGNENPMQSVLLSQLYKDRQLYSSKIPVLEREKTYYNEAISNSKATIRRPQLLSKSNQEIHATLSLYGQLFGEIFDNPSLLSPIYYNPSYKCLDEIIEILTEALLANQFDSKQEHTLIHIMEDIMTFEFQHSKDLTTYLRENTAATKLLGAYLKREPVAIFITNIIEEACNHCLENKKEDLEIDPSAINSLKGANDPTIGELCNKRRAKLKEYIDFILLKIMNPNRYPIGLRIICKKLAELASSKDPNNKRLKCSLIGGFVFLRIFNPKIAYYGKLKSQQDEYKKYAQRIRRKFTLISKILQNISNQVQGGTKERWMASMNQYIVSKYQSVSKCFEELVNIPSLTSFLYLDRQILANSAQNEMIYISMKDLKLLTRMILNDKNKKLNEINQTNKRYYDLISEIAEKNIFSIYDNASYYVDIIIRKPEKIKNNEIICIKYSSLELNLKRNVIPVLRELYGQEQLIEYLLNLQASNLVNDTINLLQFAQQKLNMYCSRNAMNVLINYHNPSVTKKLLIKLYNECLINTKIFNRLYVEIVAMKKYEIKLQKEVKHLNIEYQRIKRQQEKTEKRLRLNNIFKLIKKKNLIRGNNKGNKYDNKCKQKQIEAKVDIPSYCICGNDLILTLPQIYGWNVMVFCNKCLSKIVSTDIIYHCSKLNIATHPNGFDLCHSCYFKLVSPN